MFEVHKGQCSVQRWIHVLQFSHLFKATKWRAHETYICRLVTWWEFGGSHSVCLNHKKNEYQWDTVKTAFNRTKIKVYSRDRSCWTKRLGFLRSTVNIWCDPKLKIIRILTFWLKANSCKRCVTMLVHTNTKSSTIFQKKLKLCIPKILWEQISIPTDNSVVVTCWSLLIHSRNMAKSAIHKLLTEILYGIEKLIISDL